MIYQRVLACQQQDLNSVNLPRMNLLAYAIKKVIGTQINFTIAHGNSSVEVRVVIEFVDGQLFEFRFGCKNEYSTSAAGHDDFSINVNR